MKKLRNSLSIIVLTLIAYTSYTFAAYPGYYFRPGATPTAGAEGSLRFINNNDKPLEICKLTNFGIMRSGTVNQSLDLYYQLPLSKAFTWKKGQHNQTININTICTKQNIGIMQPHEIITLDHAQWGMWQSATAPQMAYVLSDMIIPNIQYKISHEDIWKLIISIAKSFDKPDKLFDLATMKIISATKLNQMPVAAKIKYQTPDEYKKEVEKMSNEQLMKAMAEDIDMLTEAAKCLQQKPAIEQDVAYARSPEYVRPRLDIITAEITKRLGK